MTASPLRANFANEQNVARVNEMLLLDTDAMIDVLRRYAPAVTWLRSLGSETIGIPGLVAMELLRGCRDQDEKQ